MKFENSGKLLSHIEDQLTCRRVKQLFRFERLMNRHRKAHAVRQFPLRCIAENRLFNRQLRQCVVPVLAVIKIGEHNLTAPYLPRLIRAKDLF